MKQYESNMPRWENQDCIRCGEECDIGVIGAMFCWPCQREDARNKGIIRPIFDDGGQR